MKYLLLLFILSTIVFGKTGYLQQTIKSPKNTICIYEYSKSLYSLNVGVKSVCQQSVNLDSILK